jgi:hypothetical protein
MAARIIARLVLSVSLTAIVAANRLGFDTDGSGDLQRDPLVSGPYSTVTLLARLRGWSGDNPFSLAMK